MLSLEGRDILLDVRFQGLNGLVDGQLRAWYIVMNVDHIKVARGAVSEKLAQEIETGLTAPVGNCWGREESLAFELLHVF